jgi:hypothetical protein
VTFALFAAAIYCFISSGDISRHVFLSRVSELPRALMAKVTFYVLTGPVTIVIIALPIYGFVVLPWWEPVLALLIGSILGNVLTRRKLIGSGWLYAWAMLFAILGYGFAYAFVVQMRA